jgi:hypothetical protein
MKKNKVIHRKNMPVRLPTFLTVVCYLLLDRFNAPEFIWGIVTMFLLLLWIVSIYSLVKEKQIDILNKEEDKDNE